LPGIHHLQGACRAFKAPEAAELAIFSIAHDARIAGVMA